MLIVNLGTKLTSINFDKLIKDYWDASISDSVSTINFGFQKLEWVGFEQLTFLTAWIGMLANKKKIVILSLQDGADVSPTSDSYKKRQRCLKLLLYDWKITSHLPKDIKIYSGMTISGQTTTTNIPFEKIPAIQYSLETFEEDFDALYKKHLKNFKAYSENEIKANTNLNYFDNNFLNYSIVKELYLNVCQHAYGNKPIDNNCYISLFYNKKIAKDFSSPLLKSLLVSRYSERPIEESKYFCDETGEYTNKAYLEFTFLDYGTGIAETLKPKYNDENHEKLKEKLFSECNSNKQNLDTCVLEYAFLLFTSKYEFAEGLQMHDYIPRGLYVVKDIVKRYKGLIIARSKKGKVVFDFSKSSDGVVHFRDNDHSSDIGNFPGTSITILLPSKEPHQKDSVSVKEGRKNKIKYTFLSILKLYVKNNKLTHSLSEKGKEKTFYEEFFTELCTILGDINAKNDKVLVCLDFAGISISKQGFYTKLIHFLSYSPLINERINALFFNVLDKGINAAQLSFENKLSSVGFFPHVIPCIYPDLSVNWIGIHEPALAQQLLENWKGDNNYERIFFDDSERIEGNVLKRASYNGEPRIICVIPPFEEVTKAINDYQERTIAKEINNKGISFEDLIYEEQKDDVILTHNYNNVLKSNSEGRVYLTPNGKLQKVFLSFIEKLYKKEYRRFIATYIVFNYFQNSKEDFDTKRKINKILTITLSSQLLGKEVKDILEVLLTPKNEIGLIPLSSYYDFYREQRFEEINDEDRILVINDVISTGNLNNRIRNSIKRKRKGVHITLLTIVDGRLANEKNKALEGILSLTSFPIEKLDPGTYESTVEPIWINPILNAPITMGIDKSNFQNILIHPNEFLDSVKDEEFYSVGLFKKNTVYHTYYLETENLFKKLSELDDNSEISLLKLLIERLYNRKLLDTQDDFKTKQTKIKEHILRLQSTDNTIDKNLAEEIEKSILKSDFAESHVPEFDYVFYPFFSSVSYLEENINIVLEKFHTSNPIEVYPLPRIMTPKGWRFTFPPKFLNHPTKNKRILILDDGSCSGDTIVQMVDTIGFLEVKEITVLSVFARLEDYNREFLTRINEMKVKNHIIPVKVYFGTHFNIPIYNKNTNPYSTELDELNKYVLKDIPEAAKRYIIRRKKQIQDYLDNNEITNPLIPDFVSKKEMFRVRNIIGRFDSYRLYKEDDPLGIGLDGASIPTKDYLLSLTTSEKGRNALIAVLIHEPKLIETLYRVYPTIISTLQKQLELIFNTEKPLLNANNKVFYLRILSYLNIRVLLNPVIMLRFFDGMDTTIKHTSKPENNLEDINDVFDYFAFLLYCIQQNKLINYESSREQNQRLLTIFVEKISNETLLPSDNEYSFQNLMREFLEDYRIRHSSKNQPELIAALINMDNFFYGDLGEVSHPILYSKFQEFFISYFNGTSLDIKEKSIKDYLGELNTIKNKIIPQSHAILDAFKPFRNYIFDGEFSVDTYKEIVSSAEEILNKITNEPLQPGDLSAPGMIDLYKNLEEFNNKIIDYNSPFYKLLIRDFGFDPIALFHITMSKEILKKGFEDNNITFNAEFIGQEDTSYILSHPIFFKIIYQEIPSNAIKYAPNAACDLTLTLDDNGLTLHYKQNKPKLVKKIGERGIRGFKKIAAFHNAQFEELNTNNYEFIFKFPKTLFI